MATVAEKETSARARAVAGLRTARPTEIKGPYGGGKTADQSVIPGTPSATPAAAGPKDPGAAFLQKIAAENPANTALQPGETADPTYLAFLRGAGFSFNQALQTALTQIAQAKAAYATQASRLPEQLRAAQETTDAGQLDRGTYNSGERLVRENRNTVANQQAGQDLLSGESGAISTAQSTLQAAIAQLAQQRAEAEGGLVDRRQQQTNQDRYISAVAGGGGGGGGGGSISISYPTTPPATGGPAPAAPAAAPQHPADTNPADQSGNFASPAAAPRQQPGQNINDYLAAPATRSYYQNLSPQNQTNFVAFIKAGNPNANFMPLFPTSASGNGVFRS